MAFVRGEERIFTIFENFNSIIHLHEPDVRRKKPEKVSFMGKGGWKVEHDHCCDFNRKVAIQPVVGADFRETVSHLAEQLGGVFRFNLLRKDLLRKD